jgi:L-iditol 2-dehydrogenase
MSSNNNTNPNMEQSQNVKASVLTGIHNLQQTTRLLPPPESNELQIAIKATGICGSDLHYYHHFAIGNFPVLEPLTLGHESSGIVTAVGSSVPSSDFEVGDRVALEVGIPCENCERCYEGRYNICSSMRFRSSARSVPHFQGTLQEKINHPAEYCHKLPASVSLEEGALVEPLSVGVHAARRSGIAEMPENKNACLVLGAGTIGLMVAAVLKVTGVRTIVIADVEEARVAFAVENGFADRGLVVTKEKGSTIEENLESAKKTAKAAGTQWHWGRGEEIGEFDMVFECAGVESGVQTAIYVCTF